MAVNNPMTSSAHWRVPTMETLREETRVAHQQQTRKQAPQHAVARAGAHAAAAARSAVRALVVGVLVGGVFAAPALVTLALIDLFAPTPLGIRHLAPALIFASLVWLALAIFGAHAQARYGATGKAELEAEPLHE
ncbi:MAG: hypothetical protein ACRDID_15045 [Ktedonobacterales bacterium]